jgi:hypothetical protein
MERDGAVGIATRYMLEGPGIESQNFPHPSRQALEPVQPPTQRVPGFCPGIKRPERGISTHPI